MTLTRIKWESFFLAWSAFGLYFFLATFFWASGTAPLRTVFYVFLLIPFLMVLPWRKLRIEEYGGKYTLAALVFAGYSVLSTLWGKSSDFGVYFKQWMFIAFWLSGVAWILYSRKLDMQRLYLVLIAVGAVFALVTVLFFYIYNNNAIVVRLAGMGLAKNETIVAQIFGVPALLAYVLSLQSSRWKVAQLLFAVAMICALPVVLSQTRGAALALIFIAISALIIVRPKPFIWVPQVVFLLLVIIALLLAIDVGSILDSRGASLSKRDVIWMEVIYRAFENPLFGLGLEHNSRIIIPDFDVFHHAHNTWLDILYYTGLFGLVLALWHLLLLLRGFNKHPDVLPVYFWLIFGCICQFTNGSTLMTEPDAKWWVYWVPAGLLAALLSSRRYDAR
jgi:O-antigen ligase